MRSLLSIALAGVAVYALLVAFVYFYQSRLIYFPNVPGRELTATPAALGLAFQDVTMPTPDGVELHGWLVPGGPDAPVVLFCHGNAGNISHRLEWLEILHGQGLAVLLFDYRGYGRSAGTPDESGTYRDAAAAWNYLTRERGLAARRIVIFGESLGAAIASHLAKDTQPAALILASAFTSVPDLAAEHYWYLPVRLLSRFQYPTAQYVHAVRAPTLVIHSRDDEIVPFSHGEKIFARAGNGMQFLQIRGDHNSGFSLSGPLLTRGLRRFFEETDLAQGANGSAGHPAPGVT